MILIASGLVRIKPDLRMRKYIQHAVLLFIIWVVELPIFGLIFRSFRKGGIPALDFVSSPAFFNYINGIVFFAILFFLYLAVYYVVDRSVSSRLMIEIERSPGKRLTFEKIREVYDPDKKYANELKGMIQGGFVRKQDDYYENTVKGAIFASCAKYYKRVFKLGKGG